MEDEWREGSKLHGLIGLGLFLELQLGLFPRMSVLCGGSYSGVQRWTGKSWKLKKNNKLSARIGLMPRSVSFCPSHSSPAILVWFSSLLEMVGIECRKYPRQRIIPLFEHMYKSPDDLGF